MKEGKKKFNRTMKIMALSAVVVFLLLFYFGLRAGSIEERIVEKVKKFPEVQEYKDYPANITFLPRGKLTELAKNYPVIYGNITGDVYEIKFLSDGKGLLVLYDEKENKIIRVFEIVEVKIG
ncbi:MAG: hypothetical protein QMD12_00830 [Candidatus Aenigmarchaeota archaeon]|nr:hypothetical protein [Candidatus Aenigmarchaeota archaeon]